MSKLRPGLKEFAERMEEELKKNESKGGWLDEEYAFYIRRAKANLQSITMNRILTPDPKNRKKLFVIKCCADCANFCMMIADNLREEIKNEDRTF